KYSSVWLAGREVVPFRTSSRVGTAFAIRLASESGSRRLEACRSAGSVPGTAAVDCSPDGHDSRRWSYGLDHCHLEKAIDRDAQEHCKYACRLSESSDAGS